MIRAGHLPKKIIDHDAWLAMPERDFGASWTPPGNYRTWGPNRKGIVVHIAHPFNEDDCSYAVRPVIRVPMQRRAV